MSQYWLLKSEPSSYSFEDLVRDGRTVWDGIGNNLALKHLRGARKGDLAFIYHTGAVRAVVGTARIVSDPYPDPALGNTRRTVVDLEPVEPLARPVSLSEIKSDPEFSGFALVKMPRLSVMPVSAGCWKRILKMAQQSL